jgi:hypothetical protein
VQRVLLGRRGSGVVGAGAAGLVGQIEKVAARGIVPDDPPYGAGHSVVVAGADNPVRAGHAAFVYSWRMPASRSCRWMSRWSIR